MIETLTRQKLEAMREPIPAMLEDRRMALITSWDDTSCVFDAYKGNDHDGQYRARFKGNCILFNGAIIIGLRGVERLDVPVVEQFVMEHGPFDDYEQHLIEIGQRGAAEMRYKRRAGRAVA